MEFKWKKGTINIGWEIKKAMQAKGMLIKELAKAVGIKPTPMREIMERTEIGTERLYPLVIEAGEWKRKYPPSRLVRYIEKKYGWKYEALRNEIDGSWVIERVK